MRFYSCNNKDCCLLGCDTMQFDEWGYTAFKGQSESGVPFLVKRNLNVQVLHRVAYPYKIPV